MKTTALPAALLALALAGCDGLPNLLPRPMGTPAMVTPEPAPLAELPFKTLLVDEGPGRWFAAGADERVTLRSRAELEAFLARHPRLAPGTRHEAPQPVPQASAGPPAMRPPAGAPTPELEPLPEALTAIDFGKWQLIAFVDGAVDLSTTSRITAVIDVGDSIAVRTGRWVAPPNPASGPSPASRVHIVAVPQGIEPVIFTETDVQDGTAKEGEGGYSVAGGPRMNPRWKAVPNPELTQAKVEQVFRGMLPGAKFTTFSVEKRTLEWVAGNLMPDAARQRYTLDSEVWVLLAEGDLPFNGPGGAGMMDRGIGAGEPRASRMVALVSIEEPFPHPYASMTTPAPQTLAKPGFKFEFKPDGDMHVGDDLTFAVHGEPIAGSLTLTLTVGTAAPVVHEVPIRDLATFKLPLTATTLPGLADVEVQPLAIKAEFELQPGQRGTISRDVKLVRDREARQAPLMRVQGPGTAEEYRPAAGETAWDAFARDIATTDWQGKDLAVTSRATRYGDVPHEPAYDFDIAPETPVRVYEFRGTFPTFILPAALSGRGVDEVLAPKRLVVAVTERLPVVVVGMDAYAE